MALLTLLVPTHLSSHCSSTHSYRRVPLPSQQCKRSLKDSLDCNKHGRSRCTCGAGAEEAYGHCHYGSWTWGQVMSPQGRVHKTALTKRLVAEPVGTSTSMSHHPSDKPLIRSRMSLAENWRRRGKFEEVAFIFPNAPTIPITVVCLTSIRTSAQ